MVETEADENEETERERERERLREDLWPSMFSNERLRGLAEASLEGLWIALKFLHSVRGNTEIDRVLERTLLQSAQYWRVLV